MTRKYTYLGVSVLLLLGAIGFACNSGKGTTSNNSAAASPSPTAAASSPSVTPEKTASTTPKAIEGKYDTVGTNPDGGGEYKAELTVTKRDDVYQFSWVSGKNSYDGVGVLMDGEVAVSYTDGTDGKGCGVVLYKKNSDGSMDGKIGYWGTNTMETERATRADNSAELEGDYAITGKDPKGNAYTGKLTVKKSGEGYAFAWETASNINGFGIRAGDYIAVGFGGKQCSFVGYDVQADGTLAGKWGGQGSTRFGTETAKKK